MKISKIINTKVFDDPGTAYAVSVLKNRIKAGQYVRYACLRHIRDLERQSKDIYRYVPDLARRYEDFTKRLTVLKDGSVPIKFDLFPFQQFIAYSLLGWVCGLKNPTYKPGTRKYRIAVIYTAKGNGKTPFGASFDLFMMALDGYKDLHTGDWYPEIFPDCYITASNKEQASELGIEACKDLLAFNKKLKEFFGFDFGKSKVPDKFYCKKTKAKYTALTYVRGGSGKSGKRVSYFRAEEPHEWTKDSGQLDILLHGAKNRPQQLCLMVSNAPKTMSGIAWDYRVSAIQASKLHHPENLFGFIAECDPQDFPGRDSKRRFPLHKHWHKANPALNQIITESSIESNITLARTPDEIAEVNRLNFGKVPGDAGGLFERADWDEAVVDELSDDEFSELYAPDKCKLYLALDLAERRNFTALGELYVPHDKNVKPIQRVRYWTPETGLEERDRVSTGKLVLWSKRGYIWKTEGRVIKYRTVGKYIHDLCKVYDDYEITADPYRTRHLVDDCNSNGFPMDLIVTKEDLNELEDRGQIKIMGHSQGYFPNKVTMLGMDQSISDFQLCVLEKLIQYEKNPVTSWCLECVQVKTDEHNMKKLDKKTATKHDRGTDDGVTVSVMAAGLWQIYVRREGISIEHWLKREYAKSDHKYNPFGHY